MRQNEIADKILTSFVRETDRSTGASEIMSWQNSMMYMKNIIDDTAPILKITLADNKIVRVILPTINSQNQTRTPL